MIFPTFPFSFSLSLLMTFSLHHIRRREIVISEHPDTHNYSNTTTTANIITIIIMIIIIIIINITVILYPTRLIKRKTTATTATPYQPRKEIWKKGSEVIPTSTTLDSCMEREAGRLGETAMKSSPRPPLSAPVWRERWDDWGRLEAHLPNSGLWYLPYTQCGIMGDPRDRWMAEREQEYRTQYSRFLSLRQSQRRGKSSGEIRVLKILPKPTYPVSYGGGRQDMPRPS